MYCPSGFPVITTAPTERSPRNDPNSSLSSRTISAVMKLCGGWSIRTTSTRPWRSVSNRGISEAYARELSVKSDVYVVAVVGVREAVWVRGAVRVPAVDQLGWLLPRRQRTELPGDRPAGTVGRDVGARNPIDRRDVHGPAVVVIRDVAARGVPRVVRAERRDRDGVLLADRADQVDDPRVDRAGLDVDHLELVRELDVPPVDRRVGGAGQRDGVGNGLHLAGALHRLGVLKPGLDVPLGVVVLEEARPQVARRPDHPRQRRGGVRRARALDLPVAVSIDREPPPVAVGDAKRAARREVMRGHSLAEVRLDPCH